MRWRGSQINAGRLAAVVTSLVAVFLVLTALITPPQVSDQFIGKGAASASLQNNILDDDFDETPKPDGAPDLVSSPLFALDYDRFVKRVPSDFRAALQRARRTHFATGPPSANI